MQNKQLIVLSTYICIVIDDNKNFYERLEKQLSESSKWPSLYRFKFIVKSEIKNINKLKSIFDDVKNNVILTAILTYMASEDESKASREKRIMPKNPRTGKQASWPKKRAPRRAPLDN